VLVISIENRDFVNCEIRYINIQIIEINTVQYYRFKFGFMLHSVKIKSVVFKLFQNLLPVLKIYNARKLSFSLLTVNFETAIIAFWNFARPIKDTKLAGEMLQELIHGRQWVSREISFATVVKFFMINFAFSSSLDLSVYTNHIEEFYNYKASFSAKRSKCNSIRYRSF